MFKPRRLCFVVFCCVLLVLAVLSETCAGAAVRYRRTVPDNTDETVCHETTPCGWAVYEKYTRSIDYFMKNKCDCPNNRRCIRTEDDISISAFVYRCKNYPEIETTTPNS